MMGSDKQMVGAKKKEKVVDADSNEEEEMEEPEENPANAGFSRVMTYYNPKSLAWIQILVCMCCGAGMPLFGYFICEMTFVIMEGKDSPKFIDDRNRTITYFVSLCLIMGFCSFCQKLIFSVTGENLTYHVRTEFFESLLHK